jgi:hypothetical protein
MDSTTIVRFRKMLSAGMSQYGLKPADLADHQHLPERRLPRFNDNRTIKCLCRGIGDQRRRSVTKLYEHAFEAGRSLSPDWGYRMLCMMHVTKKVATWRASRDPGEDDWIWDMDRARLNEPWGDPDPRVYNWGPPPIAIPNRHAARFAREIARLLTNERNPLRQPWVRHADQDGVAALLQSFFEANQEGMAGNFASWYTAVDLQYCVVVDDSRREITRMRIRDGRKSRVEDVSTGASSFEIHFRGSRQASQGDRLPKPEEVIYALLTHDLDREARDRDKKMR